MSSKRRKKRAAKSAKDKQEKKPALIFGDNRVLALARDNSWMTILSMIALLAFSLRLYHLGSESIWLDEAFSIKMAGNSLAYIMANFSSDPHPPLYYIILHFVMWFGNSEFIVRLPSVIAGILTIPVMYLTAKRLFSYREGLISAFLLAISYNHIYYSQEARMYGMFVLFSLASICLFIYAVEEKQKVYWMGFNATALLGIYTHYFGFFILPIVVLYCLLKRITIDSGRVGFNIRGIGNAKYFGASLLLVIVLVVPLISAFLSNVQGKAGGEVTWGISSPGLIAALLSRFTTFGDTPSIVFIAFFVIGLFVSIKAGKEQPLLLGIWLVFPVAVSYCLASIMPFQPRYLIFIQPAFILIISKGITGTAEYFIPNIESRNFDPARTARNRSIFTVVIILLFCMVSYGPLADYYSTNQKPDWRDAVSFLEDNMASGDVVVPLPGNSNVLEYYYDNSSQGTTIVGIPYTIDAIEEFIPANRTYTVWFVMTADINAVDPQGEVLEWLQHNTRLEKRNPRIFILSA